MTKTRELHIKIDPELHRQITVIARNRLWTFSNAARYLIGEGMKAHLRSLKRPPKI